MMNADRRSQDRNGLKYEVQSNNSNTSGNEEQEVELKTFLERMQIHHRLAKLERKKGNSETSIDMLKWLK